MKTMKIEIGEDVVAVARTLVYSEGRLLERKLFSYFFEAGNREACIRALLTYQNEDGGFGWGIEPDVCAPISSAISLEVALQYFDFLDTPCEKMLAPMVQWVQNNLNDRGFIDYPHPELLEYPHQPWWKNKDDTRILSVCGLLAKMGALPPEVERKVSKYASSVDISGDLDNIHGFQYDYPLFVYALFNKALDDRDKILEEYISKLRKFLEIHLEEHPHVLFSGNWNSAIPLLSEENVAQCARRFIEKLRKEGSASSPPGIDHWRPVSTVTGLITMKKHNLISIA